MLDLEYRNHPNANVGIVLGEVSKLVGIDVDGTHGKELLTQLAGGGRLQKTIGFQTPNGFRLLYALADGEQAPANKKFACNGGRVEILGNGQCTVMPPSRHASGRGYAWIMGFSPADRDPSPLPSWVSMVAKKPANNASATLGPITNYRNTRLFRAGCSLRRQGFDAERIMECLVILNGQCVPPMEDAEVRKIARNTSRYAPMDYEKANG